MLIQGDEGVGHRPLHLVLPRVEVAVQERPHLIHHATVSRTGYHRGLLGVVRLVRGSRDGGSNHPLGSLRVRRGDLLDGVCGSPARLLAQGLSGVDELLVLVIRGAEEPGALQRVHQLGHGGEVILGTLADLVLARL